MWPDSLAVLGLGALGGSLAWQARQAGVARVIGYSASTADASQALRAGAISDRAESVARACRGASLVAVTGGPAAVIRSLSELAPHLEPGAIVTDLAPVRRIVEKTVRELGLSDRHAGSSPVVAPHESGFHGAAPALFRGAMVYICHSSPDDSAARAVARFWSDVLEAQPVTVSAGTIDERTAWRMQLPALVAAAIGNARVGHGSVAPGGAAGGRREESTLQAELSLANRDEVLRALESVEEHLAALQALIAAGDRAGLQTLLEANTGAPGHGAR